MFLNLICVVLTKKIDFTAALSLNTGFEVFVGTRTTLIHKLGGGRVGSGLKIFFFFFFLFLERKLLNKL